MCFYLDNISVFLILNFYLDVINSVIRGILKVIEYLGINKGFYYERNCWKVGLVGNGLRE